MLGFLSFIILDSIELIPPHIFNYMPNYQLGLCLTTITMWNRKYYSGSCAVMYLEMSTNISCSYPHSKEAVKKIIEALFF